MLTLDKILEVREGISNEIQVGTLPDVDLRRLGWRLGFVYLSNESLQHIEKKHPEITDDHLMIIPQVIRFGSILQEVQRPKSIKSIFKMKIDAPDWVVVMKQTRDGSEIWVSSLYRLKKRNVEKIMKTDRLIRTGAKKLYR